MTTSGKDQINELFTKGNFKKQNVYIYLFSAAKSWILKPKNIQTQLILNKKYNYYYVMCANSLYLIHNLNQNDKNCIYFYF